ncbi:MAG: iron-containing alcohol dehydrogenase [Candidatus Marinimicrobia bacterium]|nr:iron-containing alcohol dehydrogenase [Candidatus Neomarinimicrobiota bacterium]
MTTLWTRTGLSPGARRPVVSVIDPELTMSVPGGYLLDGAVDIITHSTEAYFSSSEDAVFNDRLSLPLAATVLDSLSRILEDPEDKHARAAFSWASTVARRSALTKPAGRPRIPCMFLNTP